MPSHEGERFLDEFKAFLAFLKSLWGVLGGISVFFPLSNVLARVIPLRSIEDDGALVFLKPVLITAISTLITLFVVFWTFTNRGAIVSIQRRAWGSFLVGILMLVSYVVFYHVKASYAFSVWGWESDDPRHLLAEVPLLVAYATFFALTTRAFMLLGLLEFYRGKTGLSGAEQSQKKHAQ